MKVYLDKWAFLPSRAHGQDAGLAIYSPCNVTILAGGSAVVDTGVHIQLPRDTVGLLKSKSGLNVNHGIVGEGVIDEGYTGAIKVKLYNHGKTAYSFQRGDKLIQLLIMPVIKPILREVRSLDEFDDSERGADGFGSTGR